MNQAPALVSDADKLDIVEQAVNNLQVSHVLVQKEIVQLKHSITEVFEEILKLQTNTTRALHHVEDRCLTLLAAPTFEQGAVASELEHMASRLQTCDKVQEQLENSVIATRNEVVTISALKAIEERLEKLEGFQQHVDCVRETDAPVHKKNNGEALDEAPDKSLSNTATFAIEPESIGQDVDEDLVPRSSLNMQPESSLDLQTPTVDIQRRLAKHHSQNIHYIFQESVYDAAFFINSKCVTTGTSPMLAVALMLNLVMQLGVVSVLASDQFVSNPFDHSGMDPYRKWVFAHGHSWRYADEARGTSLAVRVCSNDEALDVASKQMKLLQEASDYMDGSKGAFLRNIAILTWLLCCAQEMRSTLHFVIAICYSPWSMSSSVLSPCWEEFWSKDRRSTFHPEEDGIRVESLSVHRILIGLGLAVCKLFVASFVMVYGCQWLTFTTSLLELLLNASALSFVLTIDETIYSVVTPLSTQGLINSLYPLELPSGHKMTALPALLIVACASLMFANNIMDGQTITHDMDYLQKTLCSKKPNFVLGTNVLGWTIFAESVPYSETSHLTGRGEDVARLIINGDPTAEHYFLDVSTNQTLGNVAAMRQIALMTLVDLTTTFPCVDLPWNPGAESDAKLGGLLWSAIGNETLRGFTRCSEVKDLCHGKKTSLLAQNVRSMCPITCGCANPKSGLWDLFQAEAGCPERNCRDKFWQERSNDIHQCVDSSLQDLKAMSNWEGMVHHMSQYRSINSLALDNLTNLGCEALGILKPAQITLLCHGTGPLQASGDHKLLHGAGFMCPVTCGCLGSEDYPLCPVSSCLREKFGNQVDGLPTASPDRFLMAGPATPAPTVAPASASAPGLEKKTALIQAPKTP